MVTPKATKLGSLRVSPTVDLKVYSKVYSKEILKVVPMAMTMDLL